MMEVALPVAARWVSGRQKDSKILVDPFNVKLRKKGDDASNIYFWCSRKKDLDCKVRVTLQKTTDEIIKIVGDHNHESDLMKTLVLEKTQHTINNAIHNVTVAPRTAFMDLTNNVLGDSSTTSAGLSHLPNPRSMARTIQRKRKSEQDMPDLPRKWEEMIVPDQFKETSDGQLFLILEAEVPGCSKKVRLYSCIS